MTHSEMNYYYHIVRPLNFFLKTVRFVPGKSQHIHFPRWLYEPSFKN